MTVAIARAGMDAIISPGFQQSTIPNAPDAYPALALGGSLRGGDLPGHGSTADGGTAAVSRAHRDDSHGRHDHRREASERHHLLHPREQEAGESRGAAAGGERRVDSRRRGSAR